MNTAAELQRASAKRTYGLKAWVSETVDTLALPHAIHALIAQLILMHGPNAQTNFRSVQIIGGTCGWDEIIEYACATCSQDVTRWRVTSEYERGDKVVWPCQTYREVVTFLRNTGASGFDESWLKDVAR